MGAGLTRPAALLSATRATPALPMTRTETPTTFEREGLPSPRPAAAAPAAGFVSTSATNASLTAGVNMCSINGGNGEGGRARWVKDRADLSITKSDEPDPVVAAQSLAYTLTVANDGPDGATGVTVVDTLPASVVFGSATPSQGSRGQASGTAHSEIVAPFCNVFATLTVEPPVFARREPASMHSSWCRVVPRFAVP